MRVVAALGLVHVRLDEILVREDPITLRGVDTSGYPTIRATLVAPVAPAAPVATLVAPAAGSALQGSPGLDRVIERLGGSSAGAASYLGFVFVVAAGLVAIAVALARVRCVMLEREAALR